MFRKVLVVLWMLLAGAASQCFATSAIVAAPNGGYWIENVLREKVSYQIIGAGGAPTLAPIPANRPAGGSVRDNIVASAPGMNGYWDAVNISNDGAALVRLYSRGDAPLLCPHDGDTVTDCLHLKHLTWVAAAAGTPDRKGLWLFLWDGNVATLGTAQFYGNHTKLGSEKPAEILPTPTGHGYYLIMDNGSVYACGDAKFFGSTGGKAPGNAAVTGAALSLDASGQATGYWMINQKGGVYSFGNAFFLGSTGNNSRNYIAGMVALPYARAYAWVTGEVTDPNGGDRTPRVTQSATFPRVALQSRQSGYAMDVLHGSTDPATMLVQTTLTKGNESQLWDFYPVGGDASTVQMVNVKSRLCVNVSQQIIQYPCQPTSGDARNDRFRIGKLEGDARVHFSPVSAPDYVLGVGSDAEGAPITLYQADATQFVDWKIVNAGQIP